MTYYSFSCNLLSIRSDPRVRPSSFTYLISARFAWGQDDRVYTFSDVQILLSDHIHTHGFNHSSYAASQVFISSPTPYLHPDAEYLPQMSARDIVLNSRDSVLNSSVSSPNFLLRPDSPSLFKASSSDSLNTQVRTWASSSSPFPHPQLPMLVTASNKSTS